MATWQLKDLRRWSDEHPLQGAKISTENDYPFTWEFPSLTLKLNNFDGSFDSMVRGDEVIIHNKQGTEIRFAGIIDRLKPAPKNHYLEVFVLNHAIQLKDSNACGQWEKDDENNYTGNIIVREGGKLSLEGVLERSLIRMKSEEPPNPVCEFLFIPDFAFRDEFENCPYSNNGLINTLIFKNSTGGYRRIFKRLEDPIDYDIGLYYRDNTVYFIVFYSYMAGNNTEYGYSLYELDNQNNTSTFVGDFQGFVNQYYFMPYLSLPETSTSFPIWISHQIFDQIRNEFNYANDDPLFEIVFWSKYQEIDYFVIREIWKSSRCVWIVGKVDITLEYINFRYINPKMIDIIRDMAILTNGLWWVTQEMNRSLPTLHFYPREAVYTTVDIAPWRSKIIDIHEEIIYREFNKELSDNIALSDVLKSNVKKYYQEQSGEYIKTYLNFMAREISDTFGISIMADVKYNNYTIGQAVTFDFVDENTTIVTCMKKNENYEKWYR